MICILKGSPVFSTLSQYRFDSSFPLLSSSPSVGRPCWRSSTASSSRGCRPSSWSSSTTASPTWRSTRRCRTSSSVRAVHGTHACQELAYMLFQLGFVRLICDCPLPLGVFYLWEEFIFSCYCRQCPPYPLGFRDVREPRDLPPLHLGRRLLLPQAQVRELVYHHRIR